MIIKRVDNINVVRDDLISGGTKRRVLDIWLPELGEGRYGYAGPCEGFAQVALAYSCKSLGSGYEAWIFTAKRKDMHLRTRAAIEAGAQHVPVSPGYLSVVQAHARRYSILHEISLLPFGLDHPRFIEILAGIALALPLPKKPKEVWAIAGSGVLTRALQKAWPNAKHFAVQVGHKPNVGFAELLKAPETFSMDAKVPPPFPSCGNYDAKAWRFIKEFASKDALFWNVASDTIDSGG